MVAVRWYLRYGLSYRDVEELLAERGITVDRVSVYRWVQRFTPAHRRGTALSTRLIRARTAEARPAAVPHACHKTGSVTVNRGHP
jgi:transposase-like protein